MSKPWMKFYPSDWRSDPALRMCSMSARGLWMEMLCIMHEAEPYGHLLVKGRPVADVDLARMAGISLKECRKSLATLREVGVFSESENGTIYSRRMVADYAKSLKDKEFGKSGGNPILKGGVNPPDKAQKPETRDQRPEEVAQVPQTELNLQKSEDDIPADASRSAARNSRYFFEAGPIRLNEADFRKWEAAYPNINLKGELMGLAGWAAEQTNWFLAISGALAKRDRDTRLAVERIKAEAVATANQPKVKPTCYVP